MSVNDVEQFNHQVAFHFDWAKRDRAVAWLAVQRAEAQWPGLTENVKFALQVWNRMATTNAQDGDPARLPRWIPPPQPKVKP